MRLFWKIYAGFWVLGALLVLGAAMIALMPAMIVGGAAFLLSFAGMATGSQTQSLAHATAALGIITAILTLGVFGALYFALRLLFRRIAQRDETGISIPPAE